MQRRTTFLAVWSLAAVLAAGVAPRLAAQTGKVLCESRGGGREQCAIERGARVELTRHLSDTPCRENSNWGVGQGFIWVSRGCRAEFTVTKVAVPPPTQGPGNATANPNQLRACRTEADRRLAAYSYDQIQVESDARQGNIAYVRWRAGTTGGLCTVAANGRIIEFTMRGEGGGTGGEAGKTTTVVCQSVGNVQRVCPIPAGATVRLVKQITDAPCRLNQTYGVGETFIWVNRGCGAEFEVTQRGATGGAAGTGLPERVTCESKGGERTECRIRTRGQVRLVRQLSTAACTTNSTWGTGSGVIWVTKGCRAEFEVR